MKRRRNRWNFAAGTRGFAYDPAAQSKGVLQQQKWLSPITTFIICLIVEFQLQKYFPDDATEDLIMGPLMVIAFLSVTSSQMLIAVVRMNRA